MVEAEGGLKGREPFSLSGSRGRKEGRKEGRGDRLSGGVFCRGRIARGKEKPLRVARGQGGFLAIFGSVLFFHMTLPQPLAAESAVRLTAHHKREGSRTKLVLGAFRIIFGSGLLSHMTLCSIIGEEELNYRVRNGIGCTLFSMAAKKFSKYN